jgi:ubiquinone/menaquinone biosynthesis C-methylase UbiE
VTAPFDLTAASFGRYRALPPGVPEAIRRAIWSSTPGRSPARVLDLGAGTGRIGRAFVDANDSYVGVDLSLAMLREFRADSGTARLVQGSGQQLPLRDVAFDIVLLMHVLTGTDDWRGLIDEACRVLAPAGAIVAGHTKRPSTGVDAQLKRRLAAILDDMGIASHRPRASREQSLAWLESLAARRVHLVAASWSAERTPREFLARHRTGARFSALPSAARDIAMQKLGTWARDTFGSLDMASKEEYSLELDLFEINPHG